MSTTIISFPDGLVEVDLSSSVHQFRDINYITECKACTKTLVASWCLLSDPRDQSACSHIINCKGYCTEEWCFVISHMTAAIRDWHSANIPGQTYAVNPAKVTRRSFPPMAAPQELRQYSTSERVLSLLIDTNLRVCRDGSPVLHFLPWKMHLCDVSFLFQLFAHVN